MAQPKTLEQALASFPLVKMAHLPTAIEEMPNLGAALDLDLWVKRDDCTGLAFGGNKVRQLEYYFGEAVTQNADVILITGAIQSNYVRTAAAFARRMGMGCHIQLEERVPNTNEQYNNNGNVLLDQLLGATLHSYPDGEDEAGADAEVKNISDGLRNEGKTPYVIPLGGDAKPLGALGYVSAAVELGKQLKQTSYFDEIIVASGSALTHSGLLFGLRALGIDIPVYGVCVRRDGAVQKMRVKKRLTDVSQLLGYPLKITENDVRLYDGVLAPGYGQLNEATTNAIGLTAQKEGLFLDPVYTGKAMAGLIELAKVSKLSGKRVLFWHTGGTPALFGYQNQLLK